MAASRPSSFAMDASNDFFNWPEHETMAFLASASAAAFCRTYSFAASPMKSGFTWQHTTVCQDKHTRTEVPMIAIRVIGAAPCESPDNEKRTLNQARSSTPTKGQQNSTWPAPLHGARHKHCFC